MTNTKRHKLIGALVIVIMTVLIIVLSQHTGKFIAEVNQSPIPPELEPYAQGLSARQGTPVTEEALRARIELVQNQ